MFFRRCYPVISVPWFSTGFINGVRAKPVIAAAGIRSLLASNYTNWGKCLHASPVSSLVWRYCFSCFYFLLDYNVWSWRGDAMFLSQPGRCRWSETILDLYIYLNLWILFIRLGDLSWLTIEELEVTVCCLTTLDLKTLQLTFFGGRFRTKHVTYHRIRT